MKDWKKEASRRTNDALHMFSTFEGQQTQLLCTIIGILGEIAQMLQAKQDEYLSDNKSVDNADK